MEESLGGRLEDLYASFEQEPLGTASIAQTHRARTREGDDVVVKVQRPGIEATMRSDLDLLYLSAQILEASIDEMQLAGVVAIVEEFEKGLLKELNFHQELANLLEFQRNLDPARKVTVPRPYPELSTRTVLTMQFFAGQPIRKLAPKSPEAQAVVNEVVYSAFKQVLVDGVFHGDPHAGNLLYGEDGRLCMIDLGMVGRVTPEQRDDIVTLAVATIANDSTTVARILLKMGTPTQRVNLNELKADIERIRSQHLMVASFGEYDSAGFIEEFGRAAGKHRIKLARDMAILGKAAATLEDIIRTLHPDVDLDRHRPAVPRRDREAAAVAAAHPRRNDERGVGRRLDAAHRARPGRPAAARLRDRQHHGPRRDAGTRPAADAPARARREDLTRGVCRRQPRSPRPSSCRTRPSRCRASSPQCCSRWPRPAAGPRCSAGTGSAAASRCASRRW